MVNIIGKISDATAIQFIKSLRLIMKDKDTKCVILRVDSPGGSGVASDAILEECNNLYKVWISC